MKLHNSITKSSIVKFKKDVKGYTLIFNHIIQDNRLTANEFRVLIILISYYSKKAGFAYPSNKRIETEANICPRTRKKIIKRLIRRKRIKRKYRTGTTNAFTFPCLPFLKNPEKFTKFKKLKPYYEGDEMRKVRDKWFVITKDRRWLEYADKENKIEWK